LFLFVLGEGVCWGGVVVDGVVLVEMWFGKVGGLFVVVLLDCGECGVEDRDWCFVLMF
jgi:hypothetical protein